MLKILSICFLLIGCAKNNLNTWVPGEYICKHCKMNIVDMRFKAAAISTKGKMFPFDSIECLFAWKKGTPPQTIAKMFVTDFNKPNQWINLSDAYLLKSDKRPSPMGAFLSAYPSLQSLNEAQKAVGGTRVNVP